MSDTETMPTALRNSTDILQEVRRAEALLRASFGSGCLDRNSLLAKPDHCSDALTTAIRALLEAQKRLAETQWPQPDFQPVRLAEQQAAE